MRPLLLLVWLMPSLAFSQEPIIDGIQFHLQRFAQAELRTAEKTVMLDNDSIKSVFQSTIKWGEVERRDGTIHFELSYSNKQTNYPMVDGQIAGEPEIKDRTGSKVCEISRTSAVFTVARGFCVVTNETSQGSQRVAETFAVKFTHAGMVLKYNQSMITDFFGADGYKLGASVATEIYEIQTTDADGERLPEPAKVFTRSFDAYDIDPTTLEIIEETKTSGSIAYRN